MFRQPRPIAFRWLGVGLLLVVLFTGSYSQSPARPSDLVLEGLKGNVKSVEEDTSTIITKGGQTKAVDRHRTRSITFDQQGRKTYEWIAIADVPPFEHRYDYDKQGRQFRRTVRPNEAVGNNSVQVSLRVFHFDVPKRTLFVNEYRGENVDPSSLRQFYEYHFDETGILSESVTRDTKHLEIFRTVYGYDSQGVVDEERLSMAENPVGQIFEYENTVDSEGNWTKRKSQMTILKSGEKRIQIIFRKISYRK